jgi:SAM-dependent methyltransferase
MSEDGPRMAADYDLVFADWDANTERLISIMSAHLPVARGTLLDATCRTGMACDAAVRMGWSVIGADAAPAMLERARARLPDLDFRVTDVRRLYEGIGQSVDAVISIGDGLPALARTELGTAVAEMRRCTRPGGTAMIVVRDFVGALRPAV